MIFQRKSRRWTAILAFAGLTALLSCGGGATESHGVFDIYGRVTWRPPLVGPSRAEFYIFSNGDPISDADITVNGQTIPRDSTDDGYYSLELAARIGDTLSYSIDAPQGSADGIVIIPDTVTIIRPFNLDTLFLGVGFSAVWNRGLLVDGYLARLSGQGGYISRVLDTRIDTTADFPGDKVANFGSDTFWVETLSGPFDRVITPGGRELPKGVVGAAGNFHEIFISITN